MKKLYIRRATFTILDNNWTFTVLSDEAYEALAKDVGMEDADAFVLPGKKHGFFKEDTATLDIIGHELVHVVVDGLKL